SGAGRGRTRQVLILRRSCRSGGSRALLADAPKSKFPHPLSKGGKGEKLPWSLVPGPCFQKLAASAAPARPSILQAHVHPYGAMVAAVDHVASRVAVLRPVHAAVEQCHAG